MNLYKLYGSLVLRNSSMTVFAVCFCFDVIIFGGVYEEKKEFLFYILFFKNFLSLRYD